MSLSFLRLVLGDLGTNCYIVGDPDSKEAFVIDPDDGPAVVDTLKERGLTCIGILLTLWIPMGPLYIYMSETYLVSMTHRLTYRPFMAGL